MGPLKSRILNQYEHFLNLSNQLNSTSPVLLFIVYNYHFAKYVDCGAILCGMRKSLLTTGPVYLEFKNHFGIAFNGGDYNF